MKQISKVKSFEKMEINHKIVLKDWRIITNRADGRGALQYIPANADPFTLLFSHVEES